MKNLILFFLFFGSAFAATAQNVHIPDANFKAYLLANKAINTNGDNEIQASEAAAFTGGIFCSYEQIADLTGIEAFTKLTALNCRSNQLSTLDVSRNTALTELNCGVNQLSTLDVSRNTALTELDCPENQLTALDVSRNTALTTLNCSENQLIALDVSQNTALTSLYCDNNKLSALDVSQNTALMNLSCVDNPKLTCIKIAEAQNKKLERYETPTTAKFSTSCD
jgi:Leucine-rich repeat (LRR) protein